MKALIISHNSSFKGLLREAVQATDYFTDVLQIIDEHEVLSISSDFNDVGAVFVIPCTIGRENSILIDTIEALFSDAQLFVFASIPPVGFGRFKWLSTAHSVDGLEANIISSIALVIPRAKAVQDDEGYQAGLSPKQVKAYELIGEGWSNKDIASELNITPSTVYMYVTTLKKVFGVSNRVELALSFQSALS